MRGLPEKAITVKPLWAWALIHAGKSPENRPKYWSHRGPTIIHASKNMSRAEYNDARDFMLSIGVRDIPRPDALVLGGIVGIVDIVDCVTDMDDPWFFGKYAMICKNPISVKATHLTVGQLGVFNYRETDQPLPEPRPWMINWRPDL